MQKLVKENKGKPFNYSLTYTGRDRIERINLTKDFINKYTKKGEKWEKVKKWWIF